MKTIHLLLGITLFALLVTVGCERKIVNEVADESSTGALACFGCHGDDETALVAARQQYEMSVHGTGDTFNRNRNNESRYASCEPCHTHQGFLANLEGETAPDGNFTRITCFTCHAPHTNGNLEVRAQNAVTLLNGEIFDRGDANQCASCHHSRADVRTYVVDSVEIDSRFGPHHGPQSDLLMGTGGYEYADYEYDDNSAHTNVAANGCLDCHKTTSLYATGGHVFSLYDEAEEYENTKGCNKSTCHDGDVEEFDYEGKQTEVAEMLDSLKVLMIAANLWDPIEDEAPERIVETADSAGALFNFMFIEEDRSHGVHNTDYAISLLESSINFLLIGNAGRAPQSDPAAPIAAH